MKLEDTNAQKAVIDLVQFTQFFLVEGPIDLAAKIEQEKRWIVGPTACGFDEERKCLIWVLLRGLSKQRSFSDSFSSLHHQQLCITVVNSLNLITYVLSVNVGVGNFW